LLREGRGDLVKYAERMIVIAQKRGLASMKSTVSWGVSSVAAPIFDHQRKIAGVFAAVGPSAYFESTLSGPIARELLAATSVAANLLGYPKTVE
jgi:DNA-binding IclR family transcriptional regulator